ncbi:MAG: DUF5916 domain-containing protein [Gemmatimonadaceae bacterium]
MTLRLAPITALLLALGAALPAPARAQADSAATPATTTRATATRTARAPLIDGRDDDAVWAAARPIEDFQVFVPTEGGVPRFRTSVRVLYDDRNLYVLARMFDPRPDSILALLSRRDVRTNSDQIKVVVDSYHDRRTGYQFAMNPAGVKRDYSIYDDAVEDESWDGVWDGAAAVDSLGWVAEFRIPLSQLRFAPREEHVFGFAVWRDVARYTERYSWPLYRMSRPGFASQLGDLVGIGGIGTPRRLEVVPYAVAQNAPKDRTLRSPADARTLYYRDPGLSAGADVKYGLSSNLTLDATINPDFGQVEADPAVLNLSAFETFFQERRPFFLEGNGIFQFNLGCGGDQGCGSLFYSRRVGRAPQLSGEYFTEANAAASTILGAAKLTGRLPSGLSLGVLGALTQEERGLGGRAIEPQTGYVVARAQQDFRGGKSGVGGMATAVSRRLDEWTSPFLRRSAYVAGVDARHRFGPGDNYQLSGYAAASRVAGDSGAIALTQLSSARYYQRPDDDLAFDPSRTSLAGAAGQAMVSKIGGGITRWDLTYSRLSPGFEVNDLGFLPQVDAQRASGWFALQFNEPGRGYRRMFHNLNTWAAYTTRGLRTDLGLNYNAHVELPSRWWVHAGGTRLRFAPTYNDRNARGGPAVFRSPAWSTFFGVDADPRYRIVPHFSAVLYGGDFGRSRGASIGPGVEMRVANRLNMELGPSLDVGTDYTAELGPVIDEDGTPHYTFARLRQRTLGVSGRVNFTATRDLSLQVYAQPFTTTGRYSDWRELGQPRERALDRRFVPYLVDDDDDASTAPIQPDPGGFRFSQFRSNTVVRWEYRPGSALFLVWQQGRDETGQFDGAYDFSRNYRRLFQSHPDNTLLIKASYWLSL